MRAVFRYGQAVRAGRSNVRFELRFTSSFISHQYIIAGVNPETRSVNYPTARGVARAENRPIQDPRQIARRPETRTALLGSTTLGDELDAKRVSWAFYARGARAVPATFDCGAGSILKGARHLERLSGDRAHLLRSRLEERHHLAAVAVPLPTSKGGNLRSVTWITPTFANSDHGGNDSTPVPRG